ncbi:RING-H2 finger protein ATL70-like [Abrus precatorius]|uniref:RING-H2 finger protein ATL70-like n=1 Tax=Abrus precatorius TaxID=3816 RepID=A0A8B8M9G1_ABRPR|nr:RING-H2 finger protein ATL70-like [Abrus precatorius]
MNNSEESLLLLLSFIILTLIVTFAAYMCSMVVNIPPISSSTAPSMPIGDTHTNHTTITVEATEPRLDETYAISKGKICNSGSSSCSSSCSICLMDYKETDLLRVIPGCGHLFHANCVDPWLRINFTCPVCRRTVGHQ